MNHELYHQGLEQLRQKDYPGAIASFDQLLQESPYFAEAYLKRGLSYYDLGNFLQAVSDYSEAIRLDPNYDQAFYGRALAKVMLKNLPGAFADIEVAIRLNDQYPAALELRGTIYRKQGQNYQAITSFKQAADLYLKQGDKDGCRRCLEKIQQLQSPVSVSSPPLVPSNPDYFQRLITKAELGSCHEALADITEVLKITPMDGKAFCCRGMIWAKLNNYQQAIADFNQALRLNFQEDIVYRNRGKVRILLGDAGGAVADFNQALKLKPDDAKLFIARGNAYRSLSNYNAAIADYTQALKLSPNHPQAYYNRGLAYTCLEEMELAANDYQQAASQYCEQEDWANYQKVLDSLKKIQSVAPQRPKNTPESLRQRLLRLVGGHWEIAERILDQVKYDYPGMTEQWYIEKAIYDLERDRE